MRVGGYKLREERGRGGGDPGVQGGELEQREQRVEGGVGGAGSGSVCPQRELVAQEALAQVQWWRAAESLALAGIPYLGDADRGRRGLRE